MAIVIRPRLCLNHVRVAVRRDRQRVDVPTPAPVPTVTHGMRWVGLDAARVRVVVLLDVNGAWKGEERGCLL